MSGAKLKPYPFCGGRAVFNTFGNKSDHNSVGFLFGVECESCGMALPGRYNINFSLTEDGEINILNDLRYEAASKWNRRVGNE